MPLRYQVRTVDGKTVYETETLGDAKRHWRAMIGSGATIRDVLYAAGVVNEPGDTRRIQALSNEVFDHLIERFKVTATPALKAEFLDWLTAELEQYLVRAVTPI